MYTASPDSDNSLRGASGRAEIHRQKETTASQESPRALPGWVDEDWAEDSEDSWSSSAEGRKFWMKRQRYLRTRGMNAFAGVKKKKKIN